jgi:predicted ATP-dependent Lon-type protease
VTDWGVGDRCRIVEHDSATRQPKRNGRVIPAVVVKAGAVYAQAQGDDGSIETFYQESGWRSGDGQRLWRLVHGTGDDSDARRGC